MVRAVAILSLIGCTGGCSRGSTDFTQNTVGDTTVVESTRPLIPDTLHPREVARIGREDGPLDFLFSNINVFAVGPDGSVFVQDSDDGIRRFSADGSSVERVARAGEGPAEIDYVIGMDVDSSGRLAAVDLGNARISVFEQDGSLSSVFRRPDVRIRYGDGGILFQRDGSLWMGMHPRPPDVGGIMHPRPAFLRLSLSGAIVDTIWTPVGAGVGCRTLSERRFRAGFWEDRREPFVPKTTWALGRDGTFAVGCPDTYSLDVYRPDGRVIRIVRPWEHVIMPDEAREALKPQAQLPVVPAERPVYSRIILPDDGRVWVWPNQPFVRTALGPEDAERVGRSHVWRFPSSGSFDVFTREGRWLATVRLPSAARFNGFPTEPNIQIRGDTLWAVSTDGMDVETIVKYEIPGLSAAR